MKLEIEDVEVSYGRTKVLFGVSLEVPEGSLVCLMVRNGVGKTTLLNAVIGLLPLTAGTVRVDGRDANQMVGYQRPSTFERARSGIGYVPQGHQVFPHLTAWENLQVVHERVRGARPGAIDDALDVFPALRPLLQRPAGLLSGGQAQQLVIARALVTEPRLLILDEPTEGIQPSIILEIEDAIAELAPNRWHVDPARRAVRGVRAAARRAVRGDGRRSHRRRGRHGHRRHERLQ